jgi:hypothetical protein
MQLTGFIEQLAEATYINGNMPETLLELTFSCLLAIQNAPISRHLQNGIYQINLKFADFLRMF